MSVGITGGGLSPAFWDSEPIICTLYKALFGKFGGLGAVRTIPQFIRQCFEQEGLQFPVSQGLIDFDPSSCFEKIQMPWKFQKN
eukprot:7650117-Karenia_brevis.AAC.1